MQLLRECWSFFTMLMTGLDINVCPIPVKTDVGQVDLVLRCPTRQVKKSDSPTCQYDGQIYFHWYKILGLLYKRALFNLQFVHNLFWLKLKWNARLKLFYLHMIYRYSMLWWSSKTLTKLKSQSQKRFKERKYQYLKYKIFFLSDINLAPNLNSSFAQNTIEDLI